MRQGSAWIVACAVLSAACGVSNDKIFKPPSYDGGSGGEAGMGGEPAGSGGAPETGGQAGEAGQGGAQAGSGGYSQGGQSGSGGASQGGQSGSGGVSSGGTAGAGGQGGSGGTADASVDAAPTCTDKAKNGTETDVDCGGSCPPCPGGKSCTTGADCSSSVCTTSNKCFTSTIHAIQSSATSTGCTVEANTTVQAALKMEPVVVASPRYSASASLHGYFVHDPVSTWPSGAAGKYTGVMFVIPKSLATDFAPGDLLAVTADYSEFFCMTELVGTAASKTGTSPLAAPVTLPASALANGGLAAEVEPYEGVVVSVKNIAVTDAAGGSNPKWWFQATGGILVANDFLLSGFTPVNGKALASLTGAIKYSYGKYLLVPRTDADIVVQ
jgi:predicted extracellular nuclease